MYRISFEVTQELFLDFMDAETKGMLIAAKAMVVDLGGEAENLASPEESKPKGGPISINAAQLCNDPEFLQWSECETSEQAAAFIRARCGINSRADLDHNASAASKYEALRREFHDSIV